MALVLDTGPIVALLSRRDVDHAACLGLIEATREPLVVPAPVVVEVDWLLGSRGLAAAFIRFLDDVLNGAFLVEPLEVTDYTRVRDICNQYADANIGFVDASVLAIVERLGEPKLATLDRRHFGLMRPRHVQNLRLLPD